MKAFIITLRGNEISEKHSKDCVVQAKKFGIDVETFDAVNGLEWESHAKRYNLKPRYKFKKGRAGVYGCFLSHYYLWRECALENKPFLILEHDGYFVRGLPKNVLDTFEDVLKLDGHDPYSKSYNKVLEQEQGIASVTIEKYYNNQAKFLEKNQTGNYMRGAYSYIIKPHAAQRVIDWISQNGFVPADQQIGDNIVDIQVTKPTVARLHPAYFNNIGAMSLTGNPELL